jgi:hypothetical protein
MQRYFVAQSPLVADAVAIAHEKHPKDQLGIDRGPSYLAIKWLQLLMQTRAYGRCEYVETDETSG